MDHVDTQLQKNKYISKALRQVELLIYQELMIGLFLAFIIHLYLLAKGYVSFSLIYLWFAGIIFGYTHSYLRCFILLKDPTIYADAYEADRLVFRHPIRAFLKYTRSTVLELCFYAFLFIIMFIIPAFIEPKYSKRAFTLFILGLSVYGISQGIFWKYKMRQKINNKYGINYKK